MAVVKFSTEMPRVERNTTSRREVHVANTSAAERSKDKQAKLRRKITSAVRLVIANPASSIDFVLSFSFVAHLRIGGCEAAQGRAGVNMRSGWSKDSSAK